MKLPRRWLGILFALTISPAMASEASDTRAFDLVLKTIRQSRLLTPKQLECVSLMIDNNDGKIATVDVREKHNRKCGGDPETSPRMFTLEVDLKAGTAKWDKNDEMEMRPVPQPGRAP